MAAYILGKPFNFLSLASKSVGREFLPDGQSKNMKSIITALDLSFAPMIDRMKIDEKVKFMGRQISRDFAGKRPLFLSILNGAFIFAADLLRACDLECEVAFLRYSSYKGTHFSGQISTVLGLDIPVKDRHIIIVEDIVDSGRTLHHFLTELKELEPASVALAALLVKPEAMQFELKIDYAGFEIPNKFVVGYGLDYNGLCRNLDGIYQLAE